MRRVELELEHRYKNKFVGRRIFKPTADMTTLGSARSADVRLLGEEVAGIHAILAFDQDGWMIADLGSEQGTWVGKNPIVTQPIHEPTVVHIGGHHLKLVPKTIEVELFKGDSAPASKGSRMFHQIIIRKQGLLVESRLMDPHQTFVYKIGKELKTFAPPQTEEWQRHEFGDVLVLHRRVSSDAIVASRSDQMAMLFDPSLRKPLALAFLMMLLVLGLIFFAPTKPNDELNVLKPEKNTYTRIIYDAKKMKAVKEKSQQLRKTLAAQSPQPVAQKAAALPTPSNAKAKGSTPQVVSKLKAAGLSQLIGKISKRASKTANYIPVAAGVSPDQGAAAPALAAPGTLGKVAKGGSTGQQFKIAGVGTDGKAGGSTSYKGVGGLTAGNVGNATVGILEEETEIEGGLDREVIAQVIKSQLGQIRYCYERQLSANPDIYGKVLVKFTIGGTGTVVAQTVGSSTLNNAMVEGCMLRRIAGWKFPQPKGGTSVLVTYPFLFKSTN